MKVSVVTDEVSSDPETALEILHSWGVTHVELRAIDDTRFPMISDYWQVRLPQLLDEFGLHVVAISPGLFQVPPPGRVRPPLFFNRTGDMRAVRDALHDEALLDEHVNKLLPASIEAAQRLGAQSIICFAFFSRSDHTEADLVSDAAIQVMRHAAQKEAEAGLTLNIEVSEPSQRTADIVRRVDHPALGINWDPGAAYQGGEEVPFPDGFDLLRPYIRHVHFKDVTTEPTGARTVVVDGVIDWRGAFAALRADNFDGYISVETHRRPKIDSTFRMLERLRALIALPG